LIKTVFPGLSALVIDRYLDHETSWDDEGVNSSPPWPPPGQSDPHHLPPVAPGRATQPPHRGYGQPDGPPPRRSATTGVWIGVAVVVVLCLCLGVAGGIGGGVLYLGHRQDKTDAVNSLQAYLEYVGLKNYPAAYDRLCDEAKAGVSREEYAQRFPPPRLMSFLIKDVSTATRDGEEGYNVKVELRLESGRTRTETYFVFSTSSDTDTYYVCP
jgi:hypothetical protein